MIDQNVAIVDNDSIGIIEPVKIGNCILPRDLIGMIGRVIDLRGNTICVEIVYGDSTYNILMHKNGVSL